MSFWRAIGSIFVALMLPGCAVGNAPGDIVEGPVGDTTKSVVQKGLALAPPVIIWNF